MTAIFIAANVDLTLPPGTVKLTIRQQITNGLLKLTELLATEFNDPSDLTIRYRSLRDNEASCNWSLGFQEEKYISHDPIHFYCFKLP